MNQQTLIGFILGLILALGLGYWLFGGNDQPAQPAIPSSQSPQAPSAAAVPEPSAPASRADRRWQQDQEADSGWVSPDEESAPPWSMPAQTERGSEAMRNLETMQSDMLSLQRRLNALTADGAQPEPQELDRILAEMETMSDDGVVGGADIPALRENLRGAARIQELAGQMEQIAANPGDGDDIRLQQLMDEILAIQQGMRSDVVRQPNVRLKNQTTD